MARCILIPDAHLLAPTQVALGSVQDCASAVGGYVEAVRCHQAGLILWVDEDGRPRRLPSNDRATSLLWWFRPAAYGQEFLVGAAVLSDAENESGNAVDIPADLFALLLERGPLRVELRGTPHASTWSRMGGDLPDYFQAALFAATIVSQGTPKENVRIMRAET